MANKVPKRISILAEDSVAELPELQELAAKGHLVVGMTDFQVAVRFPDDTSSAGMPELDEFDLILSRSACAYVEGMEKYLAEMIKGARARRYGAVKGLETEV